MVIVLKQNANKKQVEDLVLWLQSNNVVVHPTIGEYQTILGLVGDTKAIDVDMIDGLDVVESVKRISEPFKNANRKFHPEDTVIDIHGIKIGGGNFQFIAGPCSVETEEQITDIAKKIKKAGAKLLRGGAFKPRTSPYAFQGLRDDGLKLMLEAKKQTGMPIVTEIMDASHIDLFDDVDVIQVGARNMQNFELLKKLGKLNKPVLLKRGLANTIEEWLMSAEYIMSGGNEKVILCERGIRTYESYTRNTLDLSAVPLVKELSHLPVIVDPSHATGLARMVEPMAVAAAAAGADGLMIEVHNDPKKAWCDGQQSITPEQFEVLVNKVEKVREVVR